MPAPSLLTSPDDAATDDRSAELLTACADVPSWVDALLAGRPYADAAVLLAAADRLARSWTDDEVEAALAQHPRIGERSTAGAREAAMSAREQSGVGTGDELAARLREGNVRYEQRFGRVFLIRARGRSGAEVLAALERRLGTDDATELAVVRDELRQIALLRLEAVLAEQPA